MRVFEVNILTGVAMESYKVFTENLLKEIKEDTEITFGIVKRHQLAAIFIAGDDGRTSPSVSTRPKNCGITNRVSFDNEEPLGYFAHAMQDTPAFPRTWLQWRKPDIAIGQSGIEATEMAGAATVVLSETDIELPDVFTELQDRTQLTCCRICQVLSAYRRLHDFNRNPQQFI